MKRIATIVGSLILGAVVALGAALMAGVIQLNDEPALAVAAAPQQAENPQQSSETDTRTQSLPQNIIVDAKVVPAKDANLSLGASGIVAQIPIEEGDLVTEGQLLLTLDAADVKARVAKAEADLMRTQAKLEELRNGALPEEIAAAQATVDAAQARLDRINDSTAVGDVEAAEAALANARAAYQKTLEGVSEEQLIEARANAANADADRRRAQSAYNEVKWRNDVGALPEAADLEKATINYEAAQARLADLEKGVSQADIAGASAGIRQSRAQLDSLQAALPADISVAQADLRSVQAQYELLANGTRPEQIAAAEADVAAATAALQAELIALAKTELRAPFAGTVALLDINIGEQANAGVSLMRLADTTQWQIETEDLTELQVVNIGAGEQTELTFDALNDLRLSGVVKRIRPYGEDSLGDIVYRVIIEPSQQDSRLLWNMTAVAAFE